MNTLPRLFDPFTFDSPLDALLSQVTSSSARAVDSSNAFNASVFALDVEETDKEYILSVDLPSVKKEEIEILKEGNKVTISVNQSSETQRSDSNYIHRERGTFKASRMVVLRGAAKSDDVTTASLENGVLTVRVKKDETVLPKRITIS